MTAALEDRAALSAADINNLPDSAFAYIEPGGKRDASGKTAPRSLRHFPIHDRAHVENALARAPQSPFGEKAMPAIIRAAKKMGVGSYASQRDTDEIYDEDAFDRSTRLAVCRRSYDFEIRSVSRDGRRLVGRVAVFNKRTRIPDRGGDFDEEILPGFMDRSLREFGYPVMQFDHGKDPRTGTVPIGKYDVFDTNRSGYDVEGDLFDNPVVEPIRQAIQAGAIPGMSFRMQVKKDKWGPRSFNRNEPQLRQVEDADVPEAGPVVFPAYRDTRVSVRSILANFDEDEREELIRELREQAGLAVDLPYFTGQWAARSGHGGETDDESWEDEASTGTTSTEAARALALLRPVLP